MKIILFFCLIAAARGIQIECQYQWWSNPDLLISNSLTCFVQRMDFSDNSTHLTGANGSSEIIAGVRNIAWTTNCWQFGLTAIPKGIDKVFPNFEGIAMSSCGLNNFPLKGSELHEYRNLVTFSLRQSGIERIPGEFFMMNPLLRMVSFEFNPIQRVGLGLLDHSRNLQQADFRGNNCAGQRAFSPAEIPSLIQNLRENCPEY